jgi:hypothetical protein
MSIFSLTICDIGTNFLRNRSSDNIESNTKTLFNENETRLLRKIVQRQIKRHFCRLPVERQNDIFVVFYRH